MHFSAPHVGQQVRVCAGFTRKIVCSASLHLSAGTVNTYRVVFFSKQLAFLQSPSSCHRSVLSPGVQIPAHVKHGIAGLPTRRHKLRSNNVTLASQISGVNAAAVTAPPSTELIPKPVTSVLHDLSAFQGLPSLGKARCLDSSQEDVPQLLMLSVVKLPCTLLESEAAYELKALWYLRHYNRLL